MGSRDSVFSVCVIPVSLNALGSHVFQDFRLCPPVECRAKYRRIPKVTAPVSFGYVPSSLPSLFSTYLPSFLASYLPSFFPTYVPSFLLSSLPPLVFFLFLRFYLPSVRPSITLSLGRTAVASKTTTAIRKRGVPLQTKHVLRRAS